ncbi:MAG: CBS domain-containing protein [Erysipelotrichales bacterium]|nr:CBS domain-containing protein [Erysipelotrichales bacterium]
MQIKELMSTDIIKIPGTTSLLDAAKLMKKHNIGFIPVTDQDVAVGVITDRDIVLALAKDQKTDIKVSSFMTKNVKTLKPEDKIEVLHELMGRYQIKRVLVTDANQKLAGVVSLADIARRKHLEETAQEILIEITDDPSKKIESNGQRGVKVDDFPL